MTKQSAIRQLDGTVSKLVKLNANMQGNHLGDVINGIQYVRNQLLTKQIKMSKFPGIKNKEL